MRRVVLLVTTVVVVAFLAFVGYQTYQTLTSLRDAKADARLLKKQFLNDDTAGAKRTVRRIAAEGRTAHDNSDNVVWDFASRLPWLGRNVEAIQVMSRVADDTASTALPDALDLFAVVRQDEGLRDSTGRFDLEAIGGLYPDFKRLAGRLETADDEIGQIEADRLFSGLDEQALDFQDKLGSINDASQAGAKATRLLPRMLGADGRRTYLLVVQNNAEIRATGGLPGSLSLLTADDGKLALGSQRTGLDFQTLPNPVLPLTPEEKNLFGANLGEDIRDSNLTPDFPRAAQIMTALLQDKYGDKVDGVLSVDPTALAKVLKATGPIRIGRQQLTSENVVPVLLNETYERYNTQTQQNSFFATAARAVFDALSNGNGNQRAVLRQVASAASQRRLLVWSSHPREQATITGTRLSGSLPQDIGPTPMVGMYLNDATAGKIEYFLDYTGTLKSEACTTDGIQTLTAELLLRSSVPDDIRDMSPWVTGFGQYAPKGSMRMNLRLYAPTEGTITRLRANGEPLKVSTLEHMGRKVALVGILIDPGEEVRVTATISTRAGQRWDPQLQLTPGIKSRANVITVPSSCS